MWMSRDYKTDVTVFVCMCVCSDGCIEWEETTSL